MTMGAFGDVEGVQIPWDDTNGIEQRLAGSGVKPAEGAGAMGKDLTYYWA